jgi:hypothetical protein
MTLEHFAAFVHDWQSRLTLEQARACVEGTVDRVLNCRSCGGPLASREGWPRAFDGDCNAPFPVCWRRPLGGEPTLRAAKPSMCAKPF